MSEKLWNSTHHLHDDVQAEKRARLRNLRVYSTEWTEAYFKDRDIDVSSLRSFILGELSMSAETIEGKLPLLELEKDADIIIQEVESNGPFQSPPDLVRAIATTIKSHLKYNMITAMRLVFTESNGIDQVMSDPSLLSTVIGKLTMPRWEELQRIKAQIAKEWILITDPITKKKVDMSSQLWPDFDLDKFFAGDADSVKAYLRLQRNINLQPLQSRNFSLSESEPTPKKWNGIKIPFHFFTANGNVWNVDYSFIPYIWAKQYIPPSKYSSWRWILDA